MGKLGNGWHKTRVLAEFLTPLHPKINNRPAPTTGEAMPIVPILAHAEALMMVVVEWADTSAIFVKGHVLAHKIKYTYRVLYSR